MIKVINHQKNNYTYDSSNSGSVMNGTIFMTKREWEKCKDIICKAYGKAKRYNHTYERDGLAHAISYYIPHHEKAPSFCIGVTATEVIFKAFNLPRYKRQNYQIIIKK